MANDTATSPLVIPAESSRPESDHRIAYLDALRGLAALMVFVSHALVYAWPGMREVMESRFNLGHFGVVIFFLCSGYIIPASLERGTLKQFFVRRVCRIYPLYWFSIAVFFAALSLHLINKPSFKGQAASVSGALAARPVGYLAATLTLTETAFGLPHILGVTWTLWVEMIFYATVVVAFLIGINRYSTAVAAALALSTAAYRSLGLNDWNYLLFLTIMWCGTVVYRLHAGQVRNRKAVIACIAGIFLLMTVWPLAKFFIRGTSPGGDPPTRPLAILTFLAATSLGSRRMPEFLLHLGRISYSIYLMHELVMMIVPPIGSPIVTTGVWFAITLAVSEFTYRLVEIPGIAFGRRPKFR